MQLVGQQALVVLTGASRGIGRECAIQLAKLFDTFGSTLILLARDEAALLEVKKVIHQKSPNVSVELVVFDLSRPYTGDIDARIRALEAERGFAVRVLVHNAGSLGDMSRRSSELNDEAQWAAFLQTNLLSTIHFNNKAFAALEREAPTFIVNITSLLSIKPYPSFCQYSVAKASREAFFRAFAVEHPNCRVLSYSPGPVDTQMHSEIVEKSYDEEVRKIFAGRYDANKTEIHRKLLTCTDTVQRLIQLLERNRFESGSRVDYFDKFENMESDEDEEEKTGR